MDSSNAVINLNINNAIHYQSKSLDDTDENDEAERYKIFLEATNARNLST